MSAGVDGERLTLRDTTRRALEFAAVVALSVFGMPANADGPGWVQNRTVVAVANVSDGAFIVRLSPDLSGCQSAGGYGSLWASVYATHPGLNRLKADITTALVTGKPISLYLVDNTCKVSETVLGQF